MKKSTSARATPCLLVTGVSGSLGHQVLQELLLFQRQQPAHVSQRLIGTTRSPDQQARLAAQGVELRRADFEEPTETLANAFRDAERLLLVSTGASETGPRRRAQHERAITAACAAGVERLVYTSLLHAPTSQLGLLAEDHAATEALLRASPLQALSLRNAFYMEMLLILLPQAITSGHWWSARGAGRVAHVARADCARAAASALHADTTGQQTLDITGPEALSAAELVEIANTVLGTRIVHMPVSVDEFAARLTEGGMASPLARMLAHLEQALERGAMSPASGDFEAMTGRPAITVAEFLAEHRQALLGTR